MALHQLHPRRHRFPVQLLQLGQFDTRHVLEHNQHGVFVDFARSKLRIAMLTILQNQIVGRDSCPEFQIVHRLKPGFNLIDVFEDFHGSIVPSLKCRAQISSGKRGGL